MTILVTIKLADGVTATVTGAERYLSGVTELNLSCVEPVAFPLDQTMCPLSARDVQVLFERMSKRPPKPAKSKESAKS